MSYKQIHSSTKCLFPAGAKRASLHFYNKTSWWFSFMFALSFALIFGSIFVLPYLRAKSTSPNYFAKQDLHGSAESENIFSDVQLSHPNAIAIKFLKNYGVLNESENFYPEDFFTRAEFVRMVVLARNAYPSSFYNSDCFLDVKTQEFAPFICYAKFQNWISGHENGNFYPEDNLKQSAVLKILGNAFSTSIIDPNPEEDFEVTRGQAVQFLYDTLL